MEFPANVLILIAFPTLLGRADFGQSAASVSQNTVRANVVVPTQGPQIAGVIYRLYLRKTLVRQHLRRVPSTGKVQKIRLLPGVFTPSDLRASVQFLYSRGGEAPETFLGPDSLLV